MQTFDTTDAIQILKPCGIDSLITTNKRGIDCLITEVPESDESNTEPSGIDRYITMDPDGVWPKVANDPTMQAESEFIRWRPARVFQGETGASKVLITPMLPFPFTAGQLAAFMLEGAGSFVSEFYGDWADGPAHESLNAIDRDSEARTAIIQAYAAYREAKRTVGACPLALEVEADRARKAYQLANEAANIREGVSDSIPGTDDSSDRRARAVASIAKQDAEMEATARAWKRRYEKWLNAMVRELLKPAPAQTAPAPVEADGAPEKAPKARRLSRKPSWETIATPYLQELYVGGDYRSATVFYKAVKRRAGEPNSPFKIVDRELFCTGARSVAEGTFCKIWKQIRTE